MDVNATLLSYLIDRNGNDVKPVQYYLTIQCQRNYNHDKNRDADHDDDIDGALTVKAHRSHRDITKEQGQEDMGQSGVSISNHNQLTDKETKCIMNNKGRTEALAISLAALFETQPKSLEIGSTLCHKTGATIHVVHMVYQAELDIMEQELASEDGMTINPYFYTQQLFTSLQKEITELLLNHFQLNNYEFVVLYDDFAGLKKRKMTKGMTKSNASSSNRGLLRRVATSAKLNMNNGDKMSLNMRVQSVLRDYFKDWNGDDNNKKEQLYEMIDNVINEEDVKENVNDGSVNLSVTNDVEAEFVDNDAIAMPQRKTDGMSSAGETDYAQGAEIEMIDTEIGLMEDLDRDKSERL